MIIVDEKFNEFLKENHIDYEVIPHGTAFTAQQTAQVEQIPPSHFVKAVVLTTDKKAAMVVLPADRKVSLEKIRHLSGCREVRLAEESEFRSLFPSSEIGAMPPFGRLYGMKLWADQDILLEDEIFFNAGTHHASVRMRVEDFKRLSGASFENISITAPLAARDMGEAGPDCETLSPQEQDRHFCRK